MREQHPARAAPHGLAHGDELRPPSIDGPEVPHQGISQRPTWLTVGAETVEVQLVQDHRIRRDRKSTRLNSSHANISYAVFCLKKKTNLITVSNFKHDHRMKNKCLGPPN